MANKMKERIKQIATTISNSNRDNGFQINTGHFPELTAWTGPLPHVFYDNNFLTRLAFEYLQTNKSTLKIEVTRYVELELNYTDEEGLFSDIVDNFSRTLEQAIEAKGLDINKVKLEFSSFENDNDNRVFSFCAKYDDIESDTEYQQRWKKIETAEKIFKFIDKIFDQRITETVAAYKDRDAKRKEAERIMREAQRKINELNRGWH